MAESDGHPEPDGVQRNVRTREFRYLYGELPPRIQALGVKIFGLYLDNPSLGLHRLKDNSKGSHKDGSHAVSINAQYRAVYFVNGGVNVWYWVGTHAQYNRFTGVT